MPYANEVVIFLYHVYIGTRSENVIGAQPMQSTYETFLAVFKRAWLLTKHGNYVLN